MKKSVIAAVVALVFVSAHSQQKGIVEFGFNAGVNFSNVNVDNQTADGGTGLNIGASADYYFSDRWSIKGKLIYDQKGFNNITIIPDSFDPIDTDFGYKSNLNLNYFTIPVMANWHFGSKRNWYLNFGPYAGFLLGAKETAKGNEIEGFESSDFGLALGIGVKIPVSDKIKISFEYEEQSGFSDIIKNNDGPEARNSRGSLNVGVNFLLK